MWSGASFGLQGTEPFNGAADLSPLSKLDDADEARKRAARVTERQGLAEMAGGLAHDFRNILAVIQSSLNLLERAGDDRAKAESSLSVARQGIERGLRLTSRLVDLASQQERPRGSARVNQLLRELEAFLKQGVGPQINVLLDLAPDLPNCLVDPSRFSSAILNLVVNARDAMPDGGVVEISTTLAEPRFIDSDDPTDSFVRVRVRDNGSGIPPEVVGEIFNRYFTTKGEFGTGLGVPQVCAFARRIGGELRVSSKLGEGTVFDLFIPVEGQTSLWRQLDRWENEGGTDRTMASTPSRFRSQEGDCDVGGESEVHRS